MAAESAAGPGQTTLSPWMRDYRLSLALVVAGIVMVATTYVLGFWVSSTGNYSTSSGAGFAIYLVGTAGGMLILLAGTVAYYHWRGVRLSEETA